MRTKTGPAYLTPAADRSVRYFCIVEAYGKDGRPLVSFPQGGVRLPQGVYFLPEKYPGAVHRVPAGSRLEWAIKAVA